MTRVGRRLRLVGVLAVIAVCAGCAGTSSPAGSAAPSRPDPQPTAQPTSQPTVEGLEPCPATAGSRTVADGLPALSLACLGGGASVALAGLATGVPLVINLWASWCAPCQQELPAFQRLHQRAGGRLTFLGVLTKDPSQGWRESLLASGVRYPSVRDDDGVLLAREHGIGLPMTLLVRADGSVAMRYIGPALDDVSLANLVDTHLGVRL